MGLLGLSREQVSTNIVELSEALRKACGGTFDTNIEFRRRFWQENSHLIYVTNKGKAGDTLKDILPLVHECARKDCEVKAFYNNAIATKQIKVLSYAHFSNFVASKKARRKGQSFLPDVVSNFELKKPYMHFPCDMTYFSDKDRKEILEELDLYTASKGNANDIITHYGISKKTITEWRSKLIKRSRSSSDRDSSPPRKKITKEGSRSSSSSNATPINTPGKGTNEDPFIIE